MPEHIERYARGARRAPPREEPTPDGGRPGAAIGGRAGPELLTPGETAVRLRLARQTLARWRVEGKGPAFIRIGGGRIAYCVSDIETWLAERRFYSTAEAEGALR